MSDEIEQNETKEQENKVEKKFSAALKKLTAIVSGAENLKLPKKVSKDNLSTIVSDLFKEEREENIKKTKESLRSLLKQYAEMNKAFDDKEKELEKLRKQKKEEFVKAAEGLFNQIDNIVAVEKDYYQGLKTATNAEE
jgi:dimeric dUTPase (all-alpha-NTP-PPase superfamily)